MTPARILTTIALALLCAPFAVSAQATTTGGTTGVNYQFSSDGIFSCNKNNAYSQSVGSQVAVQGVYVPVSDAAVTLNTGILVYKECILRVAVNRMREAAAANIDRQILLNYTSGRNGQPYFSSDIAKERLDEKDRVTLLQLQSGALNTLDQSFKEEVSRAIAQGYLTATRKANTAYACPYSGDVSSVHRGTQTGSIWSALSAVGTPGCVPLYAYHLADSQVALARASAVDDMMTRLNWWNGNYGVQRLDENGNWVIDTPGSIVGANAILAEQSGYQQLRNANDVGQIVNALYSGIASQIVNGTNGLMGLTQSVGGQPSFLDRAVQSASQGLVGAVANAALSTLQSALQIEQKYNQAMTAIKAKLTQTATALRTAENTCWDLIVDAVCASTPSGGKCQGESGSQLTIATSTAFSQPVIDARIFPLITPADTNITNSNIALAALQSLITRVANTSSSAEQQAALKELDQLVAQNRLHTQADLSQALSAQNAVNTQMDSLQQDTVEEWGDSEDPQIGWCNVNNQAVKDRWDQEWR